MENTEQTTVEQLTIAELLNRCSPEDLKHLATIGVTALGGMKGCPEEDFSGGDFYERLNQVAHEVAPKIAPRPAFMPTDEQTRETESQVWRDRLDPFMWDLG